MFLGSHRFAVSVIAVVAVVAVSNVCIAIARSALARCGRQGTLLQVREFAEHGADVVFIDALRTAAEMQQLADLAAELHVHAMVGPVAGFRIMPAAGPAAGPATWHPRYGPT